MMAAQAQRVEEELRAVRADLADKSKASHAMSAIGSLLGSLRV